MAARKTRPRVLIIGGGIMGTSCAWEIARRGGDVIVLERSVPGAEASAAAAGIVGAQTEAHRPGPLVGLGLHSQRRFPGWARALWKATAIDIGLRFPGILRVAEDRATVQRLGREFGWQREDGLPLEKVSGKTARQLEAGLSPAIAGGVHFPADGRVDPRLLFRAVHIAAERAGVEFRTGAYVRRVVSAAGQVQGVELDDGTTLEGTHVVVAAGSWTGLVEGTTLARDAVIPARGQIVVVESPTPVLDRIVFSPDCYLIPRDDGRTLIGSTLEFVGYRRAVTAGAVQTLLAGAIRLVPALEAATVQDMWSNFRPYTDDQLPRIGPTAVRGLIVATGHYRTGILLSVATAEIVGALVLGRKSPLDLTPFLPRTVTDGNGRDSG